MLSIPSGWDTWGKIQLLREGFDCKHCIERWDNDIEKVPEEGLRKEFETLIRDGTVGIKPVDSKEEVVAEDEQIFLGHLADTLKRAAGDRTTSLPVNNNAPQAAAEPSQASTGKESMMIDGEDIATRLKRSAEQSKQYRTHTSSASLDVCIFQKNNT